MAWRRPGDKPLSEPMMVNLPTHICVTRPQWVKAVWWRQSKGKWLIKEGCCDTIHWQYMGLINWHHTHIYRHRFNSSPPGQNGCHFADIFKRIFLNETATRWIKISLKFVPNGPINNIPVLVGTKLLSQPMVVRFPMHICVTRPQWVKDSTLHSPTMRLFIHQLVDVSNKETITETPH